MTQRQTELERLVELALRYLPRVPRGKVLWWKRLIAALRTASLSPDPARQRAILAALEA